MPAEDTITLRSTVNPTLLKRALFRGTIFATTGTIALFYGGILLNASTLQVWGLPLLALGFGGIAVGLIPYRRLTMLRNTPHELLVSDSGTFTFFSRGKKLFTVPFSMVETNRYVEAPLNYGIGVTVKKDGPDAAKILVHASDFDMARFQKTCLQHHHCELFFPHFSDDANTTLTDCLNATHGED